MKYIETIFTTFITVKYSEVKTNKLKEAHQKENKTWVWGRNLITVPGFFPGENI